MGLSHKAMIRQLEARRKAVSVERDKLRDLVDEYDGLAETCERAECALREAIDALSELA